MTGCEIIPGIEEPAIWICPITNIDRQDQSFGKVTCYHSYDTKTTRDITVLDMIGFQCLGPNAFASLKSHHEILHKEYDKLRHKN